MDGTLVNSEPSWIRAEHELVAARGNGAWSDDWAHQLIGSDLLESARFIREHGEVDLEPTAIVEFLLERVVDDLTAAVPWQPGARELLDDAVTAGVPCGLVTMSWRPLADAVLRHLDGVFDAVVTGDMLPDGQGKPHPRPYRLGAEQLGVDAADCVAIEDSGTGVASALAAGCRVIGVPNALLTLAERPGLTVLPTLEGVTLANLGEHSFDRFLNGAANHGSGRHDGI